jgi:hypothetical protein
MMTQNDLVVVGIDVAKDKVDACIRALSLRQTCPSTAQGHRKLVAWLRKHQVDKAVMEASGGYERGWAKVLRQAGIEVRIVDPNGSAASRCRPDGWPRMTRSTRR